MLAGASKTRTFLSEQAVLLPLCPHAISLSEEETPVWLLPSDSSDHKPQKKSSSQSSRSDRQIRFLSLCLQVSESAVIKFDKLMVM